MSTIPREKVARIVEDLARCTRTISAIAERHHVSTEIVFQLREQFGPGPLELAAAAQELRRPALPPKPAESAPAPASPASPEQVAELVAEVCPPMPAPPRYYDHLTGPERRACRAWAGLPVSSHNVPRAALDAWTAAGRPVPEVPDAEPDVPDATEPTPESRELDWHIQPDARARFAAAVVGELDRLLAECLEIPALATECQAVADAVSMLRDARAEWDHREALVGRIADRLAQARTEVDLDDRGIVALVLDSIEAA